MRRVVLTCLALATLSIASTLGATASRAADAPSTFPDVPSSHPFASEIAWIIEHDITTGYNDGYFKPSMPVTRQAMAAFLYRLVGEPPFTAPSSATFTDVPAGTTGGGGHPFFHEIEWLASTGVTTGWSDGTFRPGAAVSRQAMAAFMYRLAGEPDFEPPATPSFLDVGIPPAAGSDFFMEVEWLSASQVSTGYPVVGTGKSTFAPRASVSRQAMAAFLQRVGPYLNAEWGTDYVAECADGLDNDDDGDVDLADEECVSDLDPSEAAPTAPATYGNPQGGADTSASGLPIARPGTTKTVGTGTAGSCTSAALQQAILGGGYVVFNCGAAPVTIPVTSTLYLCNTHTCAPPWQGGTSVDLLVVDGGSLVTLDGGGSRGIFYANTCEEEFGWRDASCQNDSTPRVVFQNIGFTGGNATTIQSGWEGPGGGGGGGAIAMRGGQLGLYNVRLWNNSCITAHSDAGGGAVRLTGQTTRSYIVNTTVESNQCANGGGVSVLHAEVHILNSTVLNNTATGSGANSGLGGNGGGVYSDGNRPEVMVDGSVISGNYAPEGGPGVFYVSNDRTGHLTIRNSFLVSNTGQRFYTSPYRDIFYLGRQALPTVVNSTVE